MALKKVWMSQHAGHYSLRVLGGSLAIGVLAMLLAVAGVVLSFRFHWPRELSMLLLCIGRTALILILVLCLCRKAVGDVTVFFLTENDRLYITDARFFSDHGHNVPGHVAGTIKTQRFLNCLAQMPHLPPGPN